jgi:hypothetical protein
MGGESMTIPNMTAAAGGLTQGCAIRLAAAVVTPQAGGPPTVCSGNSAAFVHNDAATQGNWVGACGTPGAPMTTNYLVDTSGGLSQAVAETDGNGNLAAYYLRVGDELLAVMRPGATAGTWSTRFVHSDGLGSVRALTDETYEGLRSVWHEERRGGE